jgi:HSF-type DNA-binding
MNNAPGAAPTAANHRADEFEDLFPAKLHYVLEQVEKDQEQHGGGGGGVISWQPHGKAFLVKDREKFVNEYLPKYVPVGTIGWLARSARSRSAPAHVLPFVCLLFSQLVPSEHLGLVPEAAQSLRLQADHRRYVRCCNCQIFSQRKHRVNDVSPSFCPIIMPLDDIFSPGPGESTTPSFVSCRVVRPVLPLTCSCCPDVSP